MTGIPRPRTLTARTVVGLLILAAYVGTIVAANAAVAQYGMVPVGFGLLAQPGVYFAGVGFTLRDLGQEYAGRIAVLVAIVLGAGVSLLVGSAGLALASAVSFAVSELADMAVYTPLRERRWLLAVAASNVVGLLVDSMLFLWLAFGSLQFLAGQIVGKAVMTAAAVLLLAVVRAAAARRRVRAV